MNKEQFDHVFNTIFVNAIKEGYSLPLPPTAEEIKHSWNSMQQKLTKSNDQLPVSSTMIELSPPNHKR
jgi:hypothetical protein